jgi:hypothetical protein
MDTLPSEVVTHLARTFLCDQDRLSLASTSRHLRNVAGVDRPSVIFDHVLTVSDQEGFTRSRNGYWHVTDPSLDSMDADRLGHLAATDPWRFVRQWASNTEVGSPPRTVAFRRACLNSMCMQADRWHRDILSALRLLLHCGHRGCPSFCRRVLSATDTQILRQAIWYARLDIVAALLDHGNLDVDMNNGTPLRLALSTIGYENSEAAMLPTIEELLRRGADPVRDRLWGIRLSLQRRFYQVAGRLCAYAWRWPNGTTMLVSLACDLDSEQAHVILMSLVDDDDTRS